MNRPICKYCGRPGATKGKKLSGNGQKYRNVCRVCRGQRFMGVYSQYKKDHCEQCGFIPIHPCQLGIHHLDENKKNNNLNNLYTLCHNCHALRTFMDRLAKLKIV